MPETNRSTSATHLTSLTVDISQLQKQLQNADKSIENTANKAVANADKIKKAFNKMNATAGSGGAGSMKNIQSAIKATVSGIESLESRFLNFQRILSQNPMDNTAFRKIVDETNAAVNSITRLGDKLRDGDSLNQRNINRYKQLLDVYKDLNDRLNILTTSYNNYASTSKITANSILQLQTQFKNLAKSMSGSGASKLPGFSELETEINKVIQRLDELYKRATLDPAKGGRGVTKQMAREVADLQTSLIRLGGTWNDLQSKFRTDKSQSSSLKRMQQDVEKLINGFSRLDSKIVASPLVTGSTSGLSSSIAKIQQELQGYYNIVQNGNQLTQAQAQRLQELQGRLGELRRAYQQTYDAAILSGQGFKVGADAVKNLQAQASKFNQTSVAIEKFYRQFLNGRTILSETSQQFQTLKQQAADLARGMSVLNTSFTQGGGIVTRQNYSELLQYIQGLEQLKLSLEQAQNAALMTGQGLRQVTTVNVQDIERAALAFANLVNQMQGKKVTDTGLNALIQQAKGYEQVLNNLVRNAKILGTVTPQMAQQFQQVNQALIPLRHNLANLNPQIQQQQQEYRKMEKDINTAVSALKKLENQAVTTKGRQQTRQLRQEYEQLANALRTMPVADAQAHLSTLNTRFEDLSRTVPTATGWINRFVTAITNRARWMIAYGILNSIFSSFTNIIKVVKETEDAVIELQRVLSNPPAQGDMAGELNQIAYEYGQTFQNVQEVAVRFAQTGMDWNDTIEATKATMLGLNTAELEVNTATQGLIAVMAQFKIDAEDLEEVIDKINITADNFPVTSEKIVAALQRAGGTASAFGMTLEQTIGTITALSQATGRSGEAIGTAMNSLISFTMKESSLKTFAQYFSQIEGKAHLTAEALKEMNVFDVWTNLSQAIQGTGDELAQMLATSSDFQELMNEEVATATGLTDEYNLALAETNQQLVDQEDIYSTVGVYRKNYFIALLNYITTAKDAIENMNGAIGYSQQENVTAMGALSKQFNQLVVAARELAVQFGEGGFLNDLKTLTAIATGILQVTKNIGGLRTVFLALATVMISVKRITFGKVLTNIKTAASGLINSFTVLNRTIRVYQLQMAMGATQTKALSAALTYLRKSFLSLGGVTFILTALSIAWGLVTGATEKAKQEAEEYRQKAIEAGEEAVEQTNKIYEAYKKFEQAKSYGVPQGALDALNTYNEEMEKAAQKNVDLSKTVFGNIDTEARSILEWTDENLEKYKNEIQSWGKDLDELRGSVSTIFGQTGTFDGVEIAFSPMLQTDDGAVLLSSDTLNKYINSLIARAGEGYTANDLIKLDTQGIETDGVIVKNVIADIGATAKETAEQMEFVGELGSVNKAREAFTEFGDKTVQQTEEYRKAQVDLLEALGYTGNDLLVLAEQYGSVDEAIKAVLDSTNALNRANAEAAAQAASDDFSKLSSDFIDMKDATDAERDSLKALKEAGLEFNLEMRDGWWKELLKPGILGSDALVKQQMAAANSYEEGKKKIEALNGVIEELESRYTSVELRTNKVYQAAVRWRGELQNQAKVASNAEQEAKLYGDTWEETSENITKSQMKINAFVNGTEEAILSSEDLQGNLEAIGNQYEEISGRVDKFQSAYSTLQDVISEYNQTGLLTADMLQSLLELEPQYLELLEVKNGVMGINNDSLGDMINSNDVYMNQLMALKIAEETNALAIQIRNVATQDMTETEIEAALASITLADDVARVAFECLNGAGDADTFRNSIKNLGEQAGLSGSALDVFGNKVFGIFNTMQNLSTMFKNAQNAQNAGSRINRYYTPRSSSSGSSGSGKSQKDMLKEALNERIEVYEHSIFLLEKADGDANKMVAIYKKMQEEIHALAEKYRSMGISEDDELIRSLQEKWWKYEDEVVKLMDGIYDATIGAHENALNLLENQYSRLDRYTDYSQMTDNLRKQYDIQRQIQEAAHNEAERLRKMGVDENDDAIQACIKAWWGAEDAIQEINSKIEASILDTYDDFISMADKFDLWDYMDISKVDYLHEKLGAVNDMFQEGTISIKEYNAQLKEIGEALYDARVEEFEKQKEDVEKEYEDLIDKNKEEIKSLEEKKEKKEEYYNKIIEGYKEEIEQWEKLKESTEEYYDNLISNLQDVEKSNERINKQLDYYKERQKIITNIEQAQARSGVAWREKEMEYQQQLIDLDEDWARTQQEWNIEDQIAELQKLKEAALGDIDKTIEKINQYITDTEEKSKIAIDNIDKEIKEIETTIEGLEQDAEDAIAAIDEDIKALGRSIAEAIKNGTADGLVDVSAEFDAATKNAVIALGGTVVEGKGLVEEGAQDAAQQSLVAMNNMLFEPMKKSIDDVADRLKQSIVASAETAAKSASTSFKQNLVQPLQNDLQSVLKDVQTTQTARTQAVANKNIGNKVSTSSGKPNIKSNGEVTNVFINNKVGSVSKGYEKAQNILQKLKFK